VLGDLYARMEGPGGVAGQNGDPLLGDDRAAVNLLVDEMDRATGFADARGERLFPGVKSLEGRQKRGMNVDDPVGLGAEEGLLDHAHVAGEDDPFGLMPAEEFDERDIALGAELGLER
jgi:hypothetical protein